MQFDPENTIVKLCARGMELEGSNKEEAMKLFQQAWEEATTDLEKLAAAHYVARQQTSIAGKLQWDETALNLALKIDDESAKGTYPSLYLNVGKCYEDLKDFENAKKNYELAFSFKDFLPDDGYGRLILSGIKNGIERMKKNNTFR